MVSNFNSPKIRIIENPLLNLMRIKMEFLKIKSIDYPKFIAPRTFLSIKEASDARGLSMSSIRSSRRWLTKRSSGWVYRIEWLSPKSSREVCKDCSKSLELKDRNNGFVMISMDPDVVESYKNIYQVAKKTGVSPSALRNACIKGNRIITRRSNKKTYQITWQEKCLVCFKLTKRC